MFFTRDDYKKIENWLKNKAIKDTEFLAAGNLTGNEIITIVQNGENRKILIKDLTVESAPYNPVYKSNIENKDTTMPISYGSLEAGTTVADIEGYSYNKLFDLILFGASKDIPDNPSVPGEPEDPIEPDPPADYIIIHPSLTQNFGAAGGSVTVDVTAPGNFTVVAEQDWIQLDKTEGSFNEKVVITIPENTSYNQRSGFAVFIYKNEKRGLEIIQEGNTNVEPEDPVVYPTFVSPTIRLSRKSDKVLFEIGAPALTEDDFNIIFDRGGIYLGEDFQDYRSGELDEELSHFTVYTSDSTSTELPEIISGNTSYKYTAYYKEGPQPKDSKGNNYDSPLSSGNIESDEVVCIAVHPWFASTEGATEDNLIKQTLKSLEVPTDPVTLQATAKCPQIFEIPEEATRIVVLESMSNTYVDASLDVYKKTEIVKNLGGINKTYYRYEFDSTEYGDRGEITLRIYY